MEEVPPEQEQMRLDAEAAASVRRRMLRLPTQRNGG
jgi:hypothetical protein